MASAPGVENIEHVVNQIAAQGRGFLLDVIGSKEEGLKQIFSSASEHSSLIIEYVQRFGDFEGFFTKENVAELTHAAGVEEELLELQTQAASSAQLAVTVSTSSYCWGRWAMVAVRSKSSPCRTP